MITNVKELRLRLRIKQKDFWGNIGVSAPSGSQYEGGRRLSAPIGMLVDLVYKPNPIKRLAKLRKASLRDLRSA